MKKLFREQVLEMSLRIEDFLNKVLLLQFRLTKSETKTLSHKSSSLSFKNKADLLFDLGKISKETYDDLTIFMEIRNQFIHNLDCTNILIAAERVKKTKQLKMLSAEAKEAFDNNYSEKLKISFLELNFTKLNLKINNSLLDFLTSYENELNEETKLKESKISFESLEQIMEIYGNSVDYVSDKFDEILNRNTASDPRLQIKNLIMSKFMSELKKFNDEEVD